MILLSLLLRCWGYGHALTHPPILRKPVRASKWPASLLLKNAPHSEIISLTTSKSLEQDEKKFNCKYKGMGGWWTTSFMTRHSAQHLKDHGTRKFQRNIRQSRLISDSGFPLPSGLSLVCPLVLSGNGNGYLSMTGAGGRTASGWQ